MSSSHVIEFSAGTLESLPFIYSSASSFIPSWLSNGRRCHVTFSDLNLYPSQEFSLYQVTESGSLYLGTYNTTDTVSLNSDYEYNIVLKPGPLSWFDNPLDNFDLIWNNAPKSLNFAAFFLLIVGVPLLVICFLW